ncbi:MAG: metallophosphoesterase family protein [Pirellula sp.]|nr:metallophosphoesterase family protein [Pirellula sp.]
MLHPTLRLFGSCTLAFSAMVMQHALAHDGDDHAHSVRQVKPAEMYEPTPMPDRIVLTWAGDPTTTQSVTWRTSTEVASAKAELAIATAGPELRNAAKAFDAATVALKTDLNTAHFHSVTFQDLTPGTKYAYRVGDGTNWSEWFHFSTAKVEQEPFSFIYFGDAQNDIRSMWSRVIREAYSDAPKAKFLLHAGDLINTAQSDAEWGEWFGAGHWLNAMIPNVPVAGNHEQHKVNETKRQLTHHWRPQFTLPEHGPEGLEESCYTFEYQNTCFVILNSNTKIKEQAEWLDNVLSKNTKPWIVCSFHHPIFSTAKDRDNPLVRAAWKPILDKYNVDLVLQGHDHSYGRTGLDTPSEDVNTVANVPTGVTARDEHHGTVYVVSVSGPKMYNLTPKPFMVRVAEDTQLYQVIHIDGMELRYEARTATGEIYDAFVLEKTIGEPNRLTEAKDLMAQRLRATKDSVPAVPITIPAGSSPVPGR